MGSNSASVPRSRASSTLGGLAAALLVLSAAVSFALAECTDNDGDGYGAFGDPSCPAGPEVDCDDTNGDVYPGAPEICDGVNNDCDEPSWPALRSWSEGTVSSAPGAWSMIAADVDGDDDLDVLSAHYSDDLILWHENTTGLGLVWVEHVISTSAEGASSVFAADVDGDGDLDVLSASWWGDEGDPITWYENTGGDGTAWIKHGIGHHANGADSVFAADLDGDGDTDALAGYTNTIAWYENLAGDGVTWIKHVVSDSAGSVASVFATDVDGDDDLDVVSANASNEVAWYENTAGDGSGWSEHLISALVDEPLSVHVADVDRDDDVDVLSASIDDDAIVWHENLAGDGSVWMERVISPSADGAISVFAADVDGDGDIDALSSSIYDDEIAWYENTAGDGSDWSEHPLLTGGAAHRSVFAADLDGDSYVDVLAGYHDPWRIVWLDQNAFEEDDDGDGLAECAGDCYDNNSNCIEDCSDVDADGIPDCADTCVDGDGDGYGDPGGSGSTCLGLDCGDSDPNNWVSCAGCVDSDSDTYFVGCDAYVTINGPDCDDGKPHCDVNCTDVDDDGHCLPYDCDDADDAVYPGAPEVCDGVNNDCNHPDWPSPGYWVEDVISEAADSARAVFAADVDGDADVDVLSASYDDDKIAWYENAYGDGTYWLETVISTTTDRAIAVVAADMDGDTDMDVLSASLLGDRFVWHENLNQLGQVWFEHVIPSSSGDPVTVLAADLDGDGDNDVVTVQTNQIKWIENVWGEGDVLVEHPLAESVPPFSSVFVADVDGDDDPDLVSGNLWFMDDFPGELAWYENAAGDGSSWVKHPISTAHSSFFSVFVADVDGDQDVDVVSYYGGLVWYENTAGDGSAWDEHFIGTTGATLWDRHLFAADLDGDGDIDVASRSDEGNGIAWYQNTAGDGSAWSRSDVPTSAVGVSGLFAAELNGDGYLELLSSSLGDDRIALYYRSSIEEDDDGDGLAECDGDCDDESASVYPGAPEINDGVDNQCPGDAGYGLIDEIEGNSGFHDPSNKARYSWMAQPGATQYQVVRFADPADPAGCWTVTTTSTHVFDLEGPLVGSIFHYLVRAQAPHTGSWGADSAGNERTNVCP